MIKPYLRKFLFVFFGGMFLSPSSPALSNVSKSTTDKIFQNMAITLISGIEKFENKNGLRIVVAPFNKENIAITSEVASEINDRLHGALLRNSKGKFTFVARDTIKDVIEDMRQTGVLSDNKRNLLPKLIENIKDFDVLISGRIGIVTKGITVSYKATSIDGILIASTGPQELPLGKVKRNPFSVQRAVKAAAATLIDENPDLETLYLGGVRYQNTGAQSPFSIWFQGLLETSMAKQIGNVLAEKQIKTRVAPGPTSSVAKKKGSYYLSGQYWVLENDIDIRVKMTGYDGRTSLWGGRIKREDVRGMALYPKNDVSALRASDGGPMFFQLNTDRGLDPVYRFGEEFSFNLRLEDEAWVYCFYRQANGQTIQILPNPEFWKNRDEPKFSGNTLHQIPDKKIFPFEMRIKAPSGVELIKCFATSRDVTDELPERLRGRSLDLLPNGFEYKLSYIFKDIPKTKVTENSLVITVVE